MAIDKDLAAEAAAALAATEIGYFAAEVKIDFDGVAVPASRLLERVIAGVASPGEAAALAQAGCDAIQALPLEQRIATSIAAAALSAFSVAYGRRVYDAELTALKVKMR